MERNNEARYILINFAAICCFALGGVFVRFSELPVCATAFYRMLFSLPLLLPLVWKQLPALQARDVYRLLIAGLLLGANLALWNYALIATSVANSNLLANMHIFTVVPLSFLVLHEKIRREFLVGIVIALAGIILLVYGKADPQPGNFLGDAAAFVSAILYGGYMLLTYQVRDRVSAMTVIFVSAFGCLIVLFPLMALLEGLVFPTSWGAAWPVLAITLVGQFGGIGLVSFCLGKLRASLSSTLSLTQPVVGALMGLFIFDEHLTWMEILGILIVSGGVYLAQKTSRPGAQAEAAPTAEAESVAPAREAAQLPPAM